MKLKTITARNFKGLTFTLELKDINFLVGSNFAGKTARTDAIRFLLLGYLPELGKTNTATFGLASGREMVVEGTFDTGATIRRRLYLQGDSVKTDNQIPKEIEDAGQLAVMLNAETYFALSDRDRVTYVANNVDLGNTYQEAAIIERLDAIMPEVNDFNPKIASGFLRLAAEDGSTPQTFVERTLAWLTTEAKAAKEYATRMEKGAQAVTTLKTQDAITTLPSKQAIDDEIEQLTRTLEGHQESKTTNQASYNAIVAARRRRQELVAKLDFLPNNRARLQGINERLQARQDALESLTVVTQAQIDELKEKEHTMRSRGARIVEELRSNARTAESLKVELSELAGKVTCPYCGANGSNWKVLKQAEINSTLAGLEEKQRVLTNDQTTNGTDHTGLTAAWHRAAEILAQRDNLVKEIDAIKRDQVTTAQQIELLEAGSKELENLPAENPELQTKVESAQSAINVTQDAISRNRRQRDQVIARETELQRIAQAEKQRDDAKAELETLVAVGKKLREIQGEMVEAAFTPLLQTANRFFGSILKTPLAYQAGEIGTHRDGVWVSHRTFSGTEKALCYAAIQAALASKSPIRIMMIDELGRLDEPNAIKLCDAVTPTLPGLIDQFIGIDATNRYDVAFLDPKTSQIVTVS